MLGKKLLSMTIALVIIGTFSAHSAKAVTAPQMSIGATRHSTCVIQNTGGMWCWGSNSSGQLGDGTNTDSTNPVQESTLSSNWRYLFDSSGDHMCAIKNDGTLWCWGSNFVGQLGLGDKTAKNVPTQVGTDTDWVSGGAGERSTCAIKSDGSLWCWGSNKSGQLGNGKGIGTLAKTPVRADLSNWLSVSIGNSHACGIQSDASLWCWGGNNDGQLGIGSTTTKRHPTQVAGKWSTVDTSSDGPGNYTCAIKKNETLWCWGVGGGGDLVNTLGLGATLSTNTPAQVGSSTWSAIGAGAWTACGIQTDASLWCWGDGYQGNLGSGIAGDENDSDVPVLVTGSNSWAAIGRSRDSACAVQTDATVWCWGSNMDGQIGSLAGSVNPTPLQVDLVAGGFNLPATDRDGGSISTILLLLAGLTAVAGTGLFVRERAVAAARLRRTN